MKNTYIVLGPPGSGKDTQAHILAESCNSPTVVVSMGRLLREFVTQHNAADTNALHETMHAGKLVTDAVVFSSLRTALATIDAGVVLTGIPRTLSQCAPLSELLEKAGFKLVRVFHLDTVREIALSRLQNRIREAAEGKEEVREDDRESVFLSRFDIYSTEIKPILAYYEERALLSSIDNSYSIEDVSRMIYDILGNHDSA